MSWRSGTTSALVLAGGSAQDYTSVTKDPPQIGFPRRRSPKRPRRRARAARAPLAHVDAPGDLRVAGELLGDLGREAAGQPAAAVEAGELGLLRVRASQQLGALEGDLGVDEVALGAHRGPLADGHRHGTREQTREPRNDDR